MLKSVSAVHKFIYKKSDVRPLMVTLTLPWDPNTSKNGTILSCFTCTFMWISMKFTSAVSSQVREMIWPLNPDWTQILGKRTLLLIKTYHLITVSFYMKLNYSCCSNLVLERWNLTLMHNTSSHSALSFCEFLINLLQ